MAHAESTDQDNPHTAGIAQFVSGLRYEDVPAEVRTRIKLLILDSILPKELPPPILLDETAHQSSAPDPDDADLIHSSKIPPAVVSPRRKGNIFGYFTITEIIIMAIGTLITAAVIFLILELY